jgi:hypothetical protein
MNINNSNSNSSDNFENVYFTLIENETSTDNLDIDLFMDELYNENFNVNENTNESENTKSIEYNFNETEIYEYELYPQYYHYDMNFTIQQLLLICEYYNIVKSNKLKKENKIKIIHKLVEFENEPKNREIVLQRKKLWFYIAELKNDKMMKKYILW